MDNDVQGGKPPFEENRAISGAFAAAEIPANYGFLGKVASARNACRKLSTGITRRSPACRRASSALSPAGTRKTSAPERLAPITFCFTPPIGATRPSSSISPVAATLSPRSTFPRSSSTMSSANASPAEGPPTPPRSIATSSGSEMAADCSTWTPMIGRPFSAGLSIVPTPPSASPRRRVPRASPSRPACALR